MIDIAPYAQIPRIPILGLFSTCEFVSAQLFDHGNRGGVCLV